MALGGNRGHNGAMHRLEPIGQGVLAWLSDDCRPGATNAGIVVDDDGLTIIDALLSPVKAQNLIGELDGLGRPVKRLVLTTSHLAHVGGSGAFKLPGVYGTAQVSVHMDQAPNLESCCRLYPDDATEIAEIAETRTRPVTHTVNEGAWISAAAVAVPVSGELAENLVVQVPSAGVVFAGAMASFGVTPMAATGDPAAWAEALDQIIGWGDIIVPGHGPVGGEAEARELQAYLRACVDVAAAGGSLPPGPWDDWPGRHYDEANIERARRLAAGDDDPPSALLSLLGLD